MVANGGTPDPSQHYTGESGKRYHEERTQWRSKAGQATRVRYFQGVTTSNDTVLDFGCGVGGVLSQLPAKKRIGVEISETAAAQAKLSLDEVFDSLSHVPTDSVDAVISFHALEHVSNPFSTLSEMRRVLHGNGVIRLVVPCDDVVLDRRQRHWRAEDRDMHLYAWTPLTLGNLIHSAGFRVVESHIEPFTNGGRIAQVVSWSPQLVQAARWLKGMRHGKFQISATAYRS